MSLREKLKALEELQQIDLEANEVKAELERFPARRAQAEAAVTAARKECAHSRPAPRSGAA